MLLLARFDCLCSFLFARLCVLNCDCWYLRAIEQSIVNGGCRTTVDRVSESGRGRCDAALYSKRRRREQCAIHIARFLSSLKRKQSSRSPRVVMTKKLSGILLYVRRDSRTNSHLSTFTNHVFATRELCVMRRANIPITLLVQ